MSRDNVEQRRTEYHAPTRAEFHRFARVLCEMLAQSQGPVFREPDTIRGLAEFLQIVGNMEAIRRTTQSTFDNHDDNG